jgi:hypothetical protein
MEANFTVSLFAKIIVASWLLAQVTIWSFEIRQQGWRPWSRASIRHSYVQYLNSLTGKQWLRLGAWFLVFFHVLLMISCLLFFHFR